MTLPFTGSCAVTGRFSGAPVPGSQTPARLCEDSLSRFGQDHRATDYVIHAFESMNGASAIIQRCGRGAPVADQSLAKALGFNWSDTV